MSIIYDMRSGVLVRSRLYSNGLNIVAMLFKYNPLKLFIEGKQGAIYDPSDLTTLWQDAAGTVPVTKSGDPVGLMKDKSGNGNHALAPTSAARLVYYTDGILHWLKQDGVDDCMKTANFGLTQPVSMAFAMSVTSNGAFLVDGLSINSGSVVSNDRALRLYAGAAGSASYFPPLITMGANHIYDIRLSGGNSYITFDNNPITIRPTGTAVMGGITIGASGAGNYTGSSNGKFYGMVVVAADISTADRQAVKAYLASKAGVTL